MLLDFLIFAYLVNISGYLTVVLIYLFLSLASAILDIRPFNICELKVSLIVWFVFLPGGLLLNKSSFDIVRCIKHYIVKFLVQVKNDNFLH